MSFSNTYKSALKYSKVAQVPNTNLRILTVTSYAASHSNVSKLFKRKKK